MTLELNFYTGQLEYRGINFSFAFDKTELRLAPAKESRHEVQMWSMKPLAKGVYTRGDPLTIEDPYLEGVCNETGKTILFIPCEGYVGSYNSVLRIPIQAYMVKESKKPFDRISFENAEIDCIHPVNQAIDHYSWGSSGVIEVSTRNHEDTTSERQEFEVDGNILTVHFATSRMMEDKLGKPPLSFRSAMVFEMKHAEDHYYFAYRLWKIAKDFIRYLCYRKNVYLPHAELSALCEPGRHVKVADLYIVDESGSIDQRALKERRYIKQSIIAGIEGRLLTDIAQNYLYMRHVPDSFSGRTINEADFVMVTAAFEWEFHRNYPSGIKKNEATLMAEAKASRTVEMLIHGSRGKLKDIYKFWKKLIGSDSLRSEIMQVGDDYSSVIDIFGNHLYALNGETLKYNEMAKRVGDQRNNFAHGKLDKDFIGLSGLDLIYLEYIIYAMQLRLYGVSDKNIRKAINDLFRCGLAL